MKAYRIEAPGEKKYRGSLTDAHLQAKDYVAGGDDWRDIEILEVEIATTKENIIDLLNGWGQERATGRKWGFRSARLGLEETTGEPHGQVEAADDGARDDSGEAVRRA